MAAANRTTSRFRYIKASTERTHEQITNVTPTSAIWDHGQLCAATEDFIAVPWSLIGAVAVFGFKDMGQAAAIPPMLKGHTAPVIDLKFHPFERNLLFTGSEDGTTRGWRIPDEGIPKSGVTESLVTLAGHGKKVGVLAWHPSAHNVLATGSTDATVKLWDVTVGAPKADFAAKDHVGSISWNIDGTAFVVATKDKKLSLMDSRNGSVSATIDGHPSSKAQNATWAKRLNQIISVGFNRTQSRCMRIFDARALDTPLSETEIDTSTSALHCTMDEDTGMAMLHGRGDGNITMYDLSMGDKPVFINQFSGDPTKGVAFLPKPTVRLHDAEIVRAVRLGPKSIVRVNFTVPRKTAATDFQEDLYPPTFAAQPSITSDEFFAGKNAEPATLDLKALWEGGSAVVMAGASVADSGAVASPVRSAPRSGMASPMKAAPAGASDWDGKSAPTEAQVKSQDESIAELEKLLAAAQAKRSEMAAAAEKAHADAEAKKKQEAEAAAAKAKADEEAAAKKAEEDEKAAAEKAAQEAAAAEVAGAAAGAEAAAATAAASGAAAGAAVAAAAQEDAKKEKKEKKDKSDKKEKKDKSDKKDKKDKKAKVEAEEAEAEAERKRKAEEAAAEAERKRKEAEEAAAKAAEEAAKAKAAAEESSSSDSDSDSTSSGSSSVSLSD